MVDGGRRIPMILVLYLNRAEKQRMYSVIQRSSTTANSDRRIFSRSADRALLRSTFQQRLSDSRLVWTHASDVRLCGERGAREVRAMRQDRRSALTSEIHTTLLLLIVSGGSVG